MICAECSATYRTFEGIPLLARNAAERLAEMERLVAANPAWYENDQLAWYDHGPCRHHLRRRRGWVEELLRRHNGAGQRASRLLDLGCGDGANLRWLVGLAEEAHGCDANLLRLRRCQRLLGGSARLCLADIAELPYPAGYFDVVFLNHVLEHVPEDVVALRSVRQVLQVGGLLILGVPNEGCWWWRLAYRLQPDLRAQSDHVHFYTAPQVAGLCSRAGFDVLEVHPTGWGPPHFRLDEKLRQFRRIDGLFEWLGSRVLRSQAASLYLALRRP